MGFKDDFEALKNNLKDSSPLFKFLILIFFFLQISSIASLSEIIVQWKGFILDGLEFYRNNITKPIIKYIKFIGLNYSQGAIDSIIFVMIIFIPAIKYQINYIYTETKNGKLISVSDLVAAALSCSVIIFPFIIHNNRDIIMTATTFLMLLAILVFFTFASKKLIRYYYPVYFSIFIVLLLAAINLGIRK